MGSGSDTNSGAKAKVARRTSSNYHIRFKHGVYPNVEGEATRADIKKYDYFFSGGQTWVGTLGSVDFVDESAQVAVELRTAGHGGVGDNKRKPSRRLLRTRTAEKIPQTSSKASTQPNKTSNRPVVHAVGTAVSSGDISVTSSSPMFTASDHRRRTSPAASSISSLEENTSPEWRHNATTASVYSYAEETQHMPWPLSDPIEAHLFRVFVDTFAPRWDTNNSHHVFERLVPQMALSNATLLNAVLMKASQTICRIDASFPAKPYVYHERVLQGLIPYLANHGRIQDEATLVAAVLLRGFEEFHAGTHGQHNLSTYELFHGPDGWNFDMSSPVVQACFMAHVHFEVYQGLLDQPSLQVDYRDFILPALASPKDDASWNNRIVWICARILQWAQGDSHTLSEWQQLNRIVHEWERERPSSFNAFFHREAEASGGELPELWFPSVCHADAHQHFRVCQITLALNKPGIGSGHIEAGTVREAEVTMWLKEVIAVARCNPHAGTTPYLAANIMHKFAAIMSDLRDQNVVMEFLEEAEIVSGWPTDLTRQCLRAAWACSTQDVVEHSNENYL